MIARRTCAEDKRRPEMQYDKTRQLKTRQDKTRQDKPRQDKTSQDKTRQDKKLQGKKKIGQDKTNTRQHKAKKIEHDKARQKTRQIQKYTWAHLNRFAFGLCRLTALENDAIGCLLEP
jgi:hypothetical protein